MKFEIFLILDAQLQFIPDVVVVKSVSYKTDPADLADDITSEAGSAILNCNIIDDRNLFTFIDPCCYSPNIEFILKKPISGNIEFNVENNNDDGPARQGYLCFILDL